MGPLTAEAVHGLHPVIDDADVGALRRIVRATALTAGAPERLAEEAALVATEMGTNLVRHAGDSYVLHRPLCGARPGYELLSVDRGPGIGDVVRTLSGPARRSPGEGLGVGLGSVQRLSTVFDIHSEPGRGTIVLSRLQAHEVPGARRLESGAVCTPIAASSECGDRWAVRAVPDGAWVLVVDGLGHGPDAEVAAVAMVDAFESSELDDVAAVLAALHDAAQDTRGGVASVCRIDQQQGSLQFAGVGNVSGRIVDSSGNRGLQPADGLLGGRSRQARGRMVELTWEPGSTLVLASDGVNIRDAFDAPIPRHCHPAVTAAAIHRDSRRGGDDATVLVVRDVAGAAA